MTHEQYWHGDCALTKDYHKAHLLKNKMENERLWLQGSYFYEALLDASPILKPFMKSGTKPLPYPKEPFPLTAKEARERKERDERIAYEERMERVKNWAEHVNKTKAQKDVTA